MISKRVMLVGSAVVGVSYMLAIDSARVHHADVPLPRSVEPARSAPPAPASASAPSVNREIAALTTSIAELKTELSTLREKTQPAASAAPQPSAKTDEQLQAEHDEYMAGIERNFEREPRDQSWAAETAQRLRHTLEAEPLMLAALRGIECRSSSCRMEIADDGSRAFNDGFPTVLHHMGAILPEAHFDHAELSAGAQLHTLYLSKSHTPED